MPSTRKIIRAFLASPGDLQEERRAIREVVEEFNESWAEELGYQVELIGWEDTVSRVGRPQHLINQDLERCDLFLGMMWKKWGTPPDNSGEFTSGFEEEYVRSVARRGKTGTPEVSLFFKEIPSEYLEDPGDDLKKVLEFQKTIIAEKKILFQKFATPREIETLARKCVIASVCRIKAEDTSSEPDKMRAKRARSGPEDAAEAERGRDSSHLSGEGFEFLEGLVERIREPDSLDNLNPRDVARFRLLANLLSRPGNDQMNLGVHDINILFAARTDGVKLGSTETSFLARLAFQHLATENVPLWCWYSAAVASDLNPAVFSSFIGVNEDEQVGAISALTALTLDLPTDNSGGIRRDMLITSWFSDDSTAKVRTAALGYLARCGTAVDLQIAKKEYDRSDHGTSKSALECMLRILLRTGQTKAAQELILDSQFEILDAELLRSVLTRLDDVATPALLLGLEHRSAEVRLCVAKSLNERGALDLSMAERLTGDSNALVRLVAVEALSKLGKQLAESEIKNVLVFPRRQSTFGLLNLGGLLNSDKTGDELFEQYQLSCLKGRPEGELQKMVGASLMYEDAPYFALVEKHFRNHAARLRCDVDDRFGAYFEERIQRTGTAIGESSSAQETVQKMRGLEEVLRKKLTRRGLNVLCAAQRPEDLQRIRANLRGSYAGASKLDAQYLRKHGEWTDITLLVNAKEPTSGETLLTIASDGEFQLEVAKAITAIGRRHSVSDLLSLEMPAGILKKTIAQCPESRFATISQDVLLALFSNKSEGVRKAAAVLTVRALPAKRIKSILREYIHSDKDRYYNIFHWLDLGVSMSREDARKVAEALGS